MSGLKQGARTGAECLNWSREPELEQRARFGAGSQNRSREPELEQGAGTGARLQDVEQQDFRRRR